MSRSAALIALALVTVAKLALAFELPLLADEAYYWVWSLRPALGYYDQPPLIAWIIAATRLLGDSEGAVRLGAVLCGLLAPLVLLPHARDRLMLVLLWCCPILFGLTLFATPDAMLLAAWALGLSAAIRGGRFWLLAGVAGGLAFLSKYTGAALLPLLILFAGPRDWRTPWPWAALLIASLMAAPNLAWNAANGWISFGFQLREGLLHDHPPGIAGPLRLIGDQLLVPTPIVAIAGAVWAARAPLHERADRLAWGSAVPLFAFFLLASPFGPPEAHWAAPIWVGLGLGLSRDPRRERLGSVGAWTGALVTAALAVHAVHPIFAWPGDPRTRLTEGPVVAEAVAAWALPAGVAVADGVPERAVPVYTERYQEAAFVHFYTGIPARRYPGCGRDDQYDLWEHEPADQALFVRPATSRPSSCMDEHYPEIRGPHTVDGIDPAGRRAGRWQVFEVSR